MKIAMVVLYIYSFHGGLVAHDHFLTMDQCAAAMVDVAKFIKGWNLDLVCIPQVPDK